MGTKLTVIDNMVQGVEREVYIERDLSGVSLVEVFREFGIDVDRDNYYVDKYMGCYVLREREGYISYRIEFTFCS